MNDVRDLYENKGYRMYLARGKGCSRRRRRIECIFVPTDFCIMKLNYDGVFVFKNAHYSTYIHHNKKEIVLKPHKDRRSRHIHEALEEIKIKEREYYKKIERLKFGLSTIMANDYLIPDVLLHIYSMCIR